MDHCKKLLRRIRTRLEMTADAVRRWWHEHRRRMTEEGAYAEAVLAVALAITDLLTRRRRVRYLVGVLIAAYVAVLRALAPDPGLQQAWS